MNRFARVLLITMTVFVMSAGVTSDSAADAGKRGTTVTVQKQGTIAPGHMRPAFDAAVEGEVFEFYDQYFNWSAFFTALFLYYKISKTR